MFRTIARKRPTKNERKTTRSGEDDRPEEDLEERPAELLVRQDLLEVAEPDRRLPPRLELLRTVRERADVVVAEHPSVADPRERVRPRVVAQRRLELRRARDRLRLDLTRLPDRHVQRAELPVHREELRALDHRIAARGHDPEGVRLHARDRLQPVLVADEGLLAHLVLQQEDEVAVLVARGRHVVRPRVGRRFERLQLDLCDRVALRKDVTDRVVREGDVDCVDDRDDLKSEHEDDARDEELQRQRSLREIDRVDADRCEDEHRERDVVLPVDQDVCSPCSERVQDREQADLDAEPDRAGERRDQPRHPCDPRDAGRDAGA